MKSERIKAVWSPPDSRPMWEWAADNITLPVGGYASHGRFSISISRWLIGPFSALQDPSIREVGSLAPVQSAKSLVSDVWIPYKLSNDPGPILLSMQTQQIAEDHWETRLKPVIKACPHISELLPEDERKVRKNGVILRNGVPLFITGAALALAQSKSIRDMVIDECWMMAQDHPGRMGEFAARLTYYRQQLKNSKLYLCSQGGTIGDDWSNWCADATLYRCAITCDGCGRISVPEFNGTRQDKSRFGLLWDKSVENVRYECEHCSAVTIQSPAQQSRWNNSSSYIQHREGKKPEHVLYAWDRLISGGSWSEMAQKFIDAKRALRYGAIEPLKEFIQKDLAQHWDEQKHAQVESISMSDGSYNPREPWPQEAIRFACVDVQKDFALFYIVIRAWATTGESRRIYRGKARSWDEVESICKEWNVEPQNVHPDWGYQDSACAREAVKRIAPTGVMWSGMRGDEKTSFVHSKTVNGAEVKETRNYSPWIYISYMSGARNDEVLAWEKTLSPQVLQAHRQGRIRPRYIFFSKSHARHAFSRLRDGKGVSFVRPASESTEAEEVEYSKQCQAHQLRERHDARGNRILEWVSLGADHYADCEEMQVMCAMITGHLTPPSN